MSFKGKTYSDKKRVQLPMKRGEVKAKFYDKEAIMTLATNIMFTQMSAKSGIKKFGEKKWLQRSKSSSN